MKKYLHLLTPSIPGDRKDRLRGDSECYSAHTVLYSAAPEYCYSGGNTQESETRERQGRVQGHIAHSEFGGLILPPKHSQAGSHRLRKVPQDWRPPQGVCAMEEQREGPVLSPCERLWLLQLANIK